MARLAIAGEAMTLRSHQTHRPLRHTGLTPLNERLSRAYAACEMTGGHVDSGDTVSRWFPGSDRVLPICARCGCPYNAPRTNWSSGTTMPRTKRGPRMR